MPYADKDKRRSYDAARRRIERAAAGRTTPTSVPLGAFRIETARDVLARIESLLQAVELEEEATAMDKARASAPLLSVALRAIEAGDVVARIEKLEAELAGRTV